MNDYKKIKLPSLDLGEERPETALRLPAFYYQLIFVFIEEKNVVVARSFLEISPPEF